jgi:hypothetical protein
VTKWQEKEDESKDVRYVPVSIGHFVLLSSLKTVEFGVAAVLPVGVDAGISMSYEKRQERVGELFVDERRQLFALTI